MSEDFVREIDAIWESQYGPNWAWERVYYERFGEDEGEDEEGRYGSVNDVGV